MGKEREEVDYRGSYHVKTEEQLCLLDVNHLLQRSFSLQVSCRIPNALPSSLRSVTPAAWLTSARHASKS